MAKKVVGINEVVAKNQYSGYYEQVVFAGVPSENTFSLIYESRESR